MFLAPLLIDLRHFIGTAAVIVLRVHAQPTVQRHPARREGKARGPPVELLSLGRCRHGLLG